MEDVNVSVVVFAGHEVKVITVVYNISQKFIFYPWKIILAVSI